MNTTASRLRLTISGRKRLRLELARLRTLIEGLESRLREELQHKDDLNWYSTKQELAMLRNRAAELESALIAEPAAPDERTTGVQIGSRVVVRDEAGAEHSFVIVEPLERDPAKGFISYRSPIGAALFGCLQGDSVSVPIPTGERRLDLLSIS